MRALPRTLPRTSTPQFLQQRRGLATVQDQTPKRTTFGGLRDQDRIFSNAYRLNDHGIKGAMVSSSCRCLSPVSLSVASPARFVRRTSRSTSAADDRDAQSRSTIRPASSGDSLGTSGT